VFKRSAQRIFGIFFQIRVVEGFSQALSTRTDLTDKAFGTFSRLKNMWAEEIWRYPRIEGTAAHAPSAISYAPVAIQILTSRGAIVGILRGAPCAGAHDRQRKTKPPIAQLLLPPTGMPCSITSPTDPLLGTKTRALVNWPSLMGARIQMKEYHAIEFV